MHDKEVRENSKRGGKERKIAIEGADGERERGEKGKGKWCTLRKKGSSLHPKCNTGSTFLGAILHPT